MNADAFVVVPSYNHARFIEKCLRSIIGQTAQPRKLLVIDDGSRDDSPKIIERILKDCPFDSELIARENRGLCRTLNQALSLADGEYFAYIGSDDFWLPEFLNARATLLRGRPNAVLGYGHAYLVDDEDRVITRTSDYRDVWADYPDGDARAMLLNGVSPISSTIVYRREMVAELSWNEKSKLEDYEMYVNLMSKGDFAFDESALAAWRLHLSNTSKDLMMMHHAVISAQRDNIAAFGIDEDDLRRVQKRIKFRYAREFLQVGERRYAIQLLRESWRSARSPFEIGKMALQFMMPRSLLGRIREARRADQVARHKDLAF